MKVVALPSRLRLAVGLLWVCVPLAALETVIVSREPMWRMPWLAIGGWAAFAAVAILMLTMSLRQGRLLPYRIFILLSVLWCAISAWMAIRMGNPTLGFFTLMLIVYLSSAVLWVNRELSRSFFDPQLAWYQGLPKPIPSLKCRMKMGDEESEFRVTRLDKEGLFVFNERAHGKLVLKRGQPVDMSLVFRDRSVDCRGLPVRLVTRGSGAGLMFAEMSADSRKELGDFVEGLRGEGYV